MSFRPANLFLPALSNPSSSEVNSAKNSVLVSTYIVEIGIQILYIISKSEQQYLRFTINFPIFVRLDMKQKGYNVYLLQ